MKNRLLKFKINFIWKNPTQTAKHLFFFINPSLDVCLFSAFIPQTFKEDKYLKDAMDCSDVIWQRGLLRKGYGICHGTAGNGYSFLSLYNLTQDRKYLYRACKVSSAAGQQNHCSLSHPSACTGVDWGGGGLMCTGAGWDTGWDNRAHHLLHFIHFDWTTSTVDVGQALA